MNQLKLSILIVLASYCQTRKHSKLNRPLIISSTTMQSLNYVFALQYHHGVLSVIWKPQWLCSSVSTRCPSLRDLEAVVTLLFCSITVLYLSVIWKLQWLCSSVSSRCSISQWFGSFSDFVVQYHHGILPHGDLEAAVTLFLSVITVFYISVF